MIWQRKLVLNPAVNSRKKENKSMQSKILEKKKLVKKDGLIFVDLTSRSIRYKNSPTVINAFYVGEDMVMRPDSLSYAAYGNVDNFDLICKFNAISNPFSIDVGDLIKIPDMGYMLDSLEDPAQVSVVEEIRNQYIDSTKKTSVDPNKIQYDQMLKNAENLSGVQFSKYNLPPNMSAPGESEANITDNGTVYLGSYVTKK